MLIPEHAVQIHFRCQKGLAKVIGNFRESAFYRRRGETLTGLRMPLGTAPHFIN